jgi:prefoldin subunit 5
MKMRFKYIFLQVIFMISLLADVEQELENKNLTKQLEQFQQQLKEVESKLKTISETVEKLQKALSNISDIQNKL